MCDSLHFCPPGSGHGGKTEWIIFFSLLSFHQFISQRHFYLTNVSLELIVEHIFLYIHGRSLNGECVNCAHTFTKKYVLYLAFLLFLVNEVSDTVDTSPEKKCIRCTWQSARLSVADKSKTWNHVECFLRWVWHDIYGSKKMLHVLLELIRGS